MNDEWQMMKDEWQMMINEWQNTDQWIRLLYDNYMVCHTLRKHSPSSAISTKLGEVCQ